MEQQAQPRASRRPVWALVVIGVVLAVWGVVQALGPVRCGSDVMLPGDSCLVLDGGASRTLTYEESRANRDRQPLVLGGIGTVLVVAGLGAGLVLARRVESPKGQAERSAAERAWAQQRARLVQRAADPQGGGALALAALDRSIAKERRRRRYPEVGALDTPVAPAAPPAPSAASAASAPSGVVDSGSGVVNHPATTGGRARLHSRRPVIRLLALAVVLAAAGLWLWTSTEPRCRNEPMAAGETCTVSQGRASVERTAEQMLQTQRTPARVLLYGAGGAAVASVAVGLYRGRRVRRASPAEVAAFEAEARRTGGGPAPS